MKEDIKITPELLDKATKYIRPYCFACGPLLGKEKPLKYFMSKTHSFLVSYCPAHSKQVKKTYFVKLSDKEVFYLKITNEDTNLWR